MSGMTGKSMAVRPLARGLGLLRALLALTAMLLLLSLAVAAQERDAQNAAPAGSSASAQPAPDSMNGELSRESNAAAGESETDQLKHSPSVQFLARITGLSLQHAYLLGVGLNFVVLAGVIFWASRKYLPGLFRGRTASIQRSMAEARKASDDANRRLADIEARLSRLNTEISSMRVAAENEAASEDASIRAAAAEDARRIIESAEQEITAAAKAARRELTAYAADLAITLAGKQIHVDTATDQSLVRSFAADLSNGGPGRKESK